jgi:hypothetical protein
MTKPWIYPLTAFEMSRRPQPEAKYDGWYRRYRRIAVSNSVFACRKRCCHYLENDLAEWLALWADKNQVSKSRILNDLLTQYRETEDPIPSETLNI